MSVWRPKRLGVIAVGALVVLAVSGPGGAGPAPRPVEIKAREFLFEPKEVTVRTGETVFVVKNEGSIEHNFVIVDASRKTIAQIPVIEPGKSEELKATLRSGTYSFDCSLPGHKEAGMHGVMRVQQ